MFSQSFSINQPLHVWEGKGAWYYVIIPQNISESIKTNYPYRLKGFGHIPVTVSIQDSEWKTSLFPDKKRNTYLLFIKKSIRQKHTLMVENTVELSLVPIV